MRVRVRACVRVRVCVCVCVCVFYACGFERNKNGVNPVTVETPALS